MLIPLVLAVAAVVVAAAPAPRLFRAAEPVTATAPPEALLRRLRPLLAPLTLLAAWVILGGVAGAGAGLAAGVWAWRVLGRATSPLERRRAGEIERDLPVAVRLFAAALAAGSDPGSALRAVAAAIGGPVGTAFAELDRRLLLAPDPVGVWRSAIGDPVAGPLARAMVRSAESGASVRAGAEALVAEVAATSAARQEARLRAIEVRATVPLGVCFLPAFVLLGVVPLLAGLAAVIGLG